ncbi:Methyltransferase domain-containing protein [Pedococcus dokdonensis]|uniref:Methyltransferase domain-containing protein n=1 Tax=Pedococcus dokdonensis TaxID=443156 RepID=A0A1H0UX11_9MICO|nr:class I SAM-dependent methyltransferase [Pedococcus dokdonensis]SDP70478.1 Methyltransferase domain-containing protein [Pedococcus dokdonensis]
MTTDGPPGPAPTRSPNIWDTPDVYELENLGVDRAGLLESAMDALHPFAGADLVDVGCGTGFHLPRFAALGCASVVGVEPHPPLVSVAEQRISGMPSVRVVEGVAQALPLADASVDLTHARWAYFFGAGSEPGLRELERVLRPGGTAYVIDNDATRSTFGRWFARANPSYDPAAVERFWTRQGWHRERLTIAWEHDSRADFEAVVRIEFSETAAEGILAEHDGTSVDYAVNLWWRTF